MKSYVPPSDESGDEEVASGKKRKRQQGKKEKDKNAPKKAKTGYIAFSMEARSQV